VKSFEIGVLGLGFVYQIKQFFFASLAITFSRGNAISLAYTLGHAKRFRDTLFFLFLR